MTTIDSAIRYTAGGMTFSAELAVIENMDYTDGNDKSIHNMKLWFAF